MDEPLIVDKSLLGRVFGAGVKRCRKTRGMKQDTLADLTQISRPRMSQIENGWLPPFDKGVVIANVLGVPLDALLQPLVVSGDSLPPAHFLHQLARCSPAEQWALVRLLRTLLDDMLLILPPEDS